MQVLLTLLLALDLASVKTEPNLERRSELALDYAGSAFDSAREAYNGGDGDKAKTALAEVAESVDLAYQSLEDTGKSARRSPKFFKKAELKTRDLMRRLDGLAKSVSLDDRELVEKVHDRVAAVHDNLIREIMKKK
jgi:hypothetical protein